MKDLSVIEKSMAYEFAAMRIQSSCVLHDENAYAQPWADTSSSDMDLDEECAYLEARGLLERHPSHPDWVRVGDESEPADAEKFDAGRADSLVERLDRIEAVQNQILEEIKKMSETQAQMDQELSVVETDLAALGTALTQAITDLQAKAAGTSIDFTSEFTALSNIATTLTSLTATATAADPGAPAAVSETPAAAPTEGAAAS
jgi:hypothetical protein